MKKKAPLPPLRCKLHPLHRHRRIMRWSAALSIWSAHALAQSAGSDLWQDLDAGVQASYRSSSTAPAPVRFRAMKVDPQQLIGHLQADHDIKLDLPAPEGGYSRFTLKNSGVIPAALAKKYPQLKSFDGRDPHGRRVRLDADGHQIRATIWDLTSQPWSVQPNGGRQAAGADYIFYRNADFPTAKQASTIDLGGNPQPPAPHRPTHAPIGEPQDRGSFSGAVLYNYRFAVATDSRYTASFGGTVEGGLSGVIHAVNQLNEIYENDLGIHLTLVADNDKLIRTDPLTDPAGGDIGFNNQSFLDKVLGKGAYDIGALFNTHFDDDIRSRGGVCTPLFKGRAVAGYPDPDGDPRFVGNAAHALGHFFGATHTFNAGTSEDRDDASAFEPGGGSTLMSYAGRSVISPQQQLQAQRDWYFHAGSIEQIQHWLRSFGGQCASKRLNSRPAAYIDSWQSSYTIPARTPFTLDAMAFHPDPTSVLTYAWEQMDLGPAQTGILADNGRGPIFRSYPPGISSQRTFPRLPVLLGKEPPGVGEALPTTTRALYFRLTVRDNQGAMATTSSVDQIVHVVDTGRAFAVTAPRSLATWRMGTAQTVRWQVAGTDRAPINCASVAIELSTDGGRTYMQDPLLSAPNSGGRATVVVPRLAKETARARVRVRCEDNQIFFALSPGDFIIRK